MRPIIGLVIYMLVKIRKLPVDEWTVVTSIRRNDATSAGAQPEAHILHFLISPTGKLSRGWRI